MIDPSRALELFDEALLQPEPQVVIAFLDLKQLAKAGDGSMPSLWRELVGEASTHGEKARAKGWAQEISALSERARLAAVTEMIRAEAARVLSLPGVKDVPLDHPLKDLGLDSLMSLELRNALAARTAVKLSAAALVEHPTVLALARHWLTQALDAAHPRVEDDVAHGECLGAAPSARARLFCFHDAGGSAEMFAPFAQMASAGVEVHGISHTRASPSGPASAKQYLDEALTYVLRFSDRPFAFFGHSIGSLFAWRVFEELVGRGLSAPMLLALSATPARSILGNDASDDDDAKAFRRIFEDRAQNSEFVQHAFTADASLWRYMPRARQLAVDVPIVAFVGRDDHVSSESAMKSWSQRTRGEFSLNVAPGGHFYLQDNRARQLIFDELIRRLALNPTPSSRDALSRARDAIASITHK
jgi:surfactin synthase thioesterase subunit/acyl carrier protein